MAFSALGYSAKDFSDAYRDYANALPAQKIGSTLTAWVNAITMRNGISAQMYDANDKADMREILHQPLSKEKYGNVHAYDYWLGSPRNFILRTAPLAIHLSWRKPELDPVLQTIAVLDHALSKANKNCVFWHDNETMFHYNRLMVKPWQRLDAEIKTYINENQTLITRPISPGQSTLWFPVGFAYQAAQMEKEFRADPQTSLAPKPPAALRMTPAPADITPT
jgi:hypothetical protein